MGVKDENGVPQTSKCPLSHSEDMQKMDENTAYYHCQREDIPVSVLQLIQFREFCAKKRENSVKQTSIFFFFRKSFNISLTVYGVIYFR